MNFTLIFIPFKISMNMLRSPIFFRNVPISIRMVGGRKKSKLSLIKTSLFLDVVPKCLKTAISWQNINFQPFPYWGFKVKIWCSCSRGLDSNVKILWKYLNCNIICSSKICITPQIHLFCVPILGSFVCRGFGFGF